MRYFLRPLATAVLFFSPLYCICFQDSTYFKRDSLKDKAIQFTPYFSKESARSLGNYVAVVDDTLTFVRSAGVSVFNTLRGIVPNSGISVGAPFARVRQNSLYVIDGLPYQGDGFYNMNTFDYNSMTVLNRGNAASVYGAFGSNGAFVIKSKTGENHFKPTVELSSYTTMIVQENITNHFLFSNAVAYMQDFGKVDTRVSYTHLLYPDHLGKANNFKVNTGFNIAPAFNARLILDYVQTARKSSSYYASSKSKGRFLQGNLALQYQPLTWLAFTSQSSWGKVRRNADQSINTQTLQVEEEQERTLINLFVRVNKKISSNFSFSAFAGMQQESWNDERLVYSQYSGSNILSYTTKSYISGFGLDVGQFLNGNFTYRKDEFSFFPTEQKTPTYSTSLAFVFSEAFNIGGDLFSFGKLRGSFGKTYTDIETNNSNFPVTPKRQVEVGSDLSFLTDRIGITFNYFNEKISNARSFTPVTGFTSYFFSVGNLSTTGTELVLSTLPVKTPTLEYKTVVLWMRTKSTIEGVLGGGGDPPGGNPSYLGNTFPSWTGSLFNQLIWKNFSWSILIDMRKGGDVATYGGFGTTFSYHDGSYAKLREISAGYHIRSLEKVGLKQFHISLSARNTMMLYSSAGRDVEEQDVNMQYGKNLSLGLNFFL